MEEDIKILKEYARDMVDFSYDYDCFDLQQAVRNILNRLEQLEKENKEKKQTQIFIDTENPEERYAREAYIDCLKEEIEQLEKEKDKLLELYNERVQEIIDLEAKVEQLEKENVIYVRDNIYLIENSIPKSEIKKKIEELEKEKGSTDTSNYDFHEVMEEIYNNQIDILKELLGEEK